MNTKVKDSGWERLQEEAADCIQRLWDHVPRTLQDNDLTCDTPKSHDIFEGRVISEHYMLNLVYWDTGIH